MNRTDISDQLIHFTKGATLEGAFQRLRKIVMDRHLLGSGNLIKGEYNCVCFSEAPLASLTNGLVNPDFYSKYSPFGIMFPKRWISEQGGRPVIYQPDNEYNLLSDGHRWRHMRYEPAQTPPIDFTWEREWRVRCNILEFGPEVATIVVANASWASRLLEEHQREEEFKVMEYALVLDLWGCQPEPFTWPVATLG